MSTNSTNNFNITNCILSIKQLNDLSEVCFKHSKFLKHQLDSNTISHHARVTISKEYTRTRELKKAVRNQLRNVINDIKLINEVVE